MILAHKIALDPNNRQAARLDNGESNIRLAVHRTKRPCASKLNAIKDEQFPWMDDVTKNAPQQAIKNLGTAFKTFFDGRTQLLLKASVFVSL